MTSLLLPLQASEGTCLLPWQAETAYTYASVPLAVGNSLATLPSETLDGITSWLDPFELARLFETGSVGLMNKMANGGVTRFVWRLEVSGDRRWPRVLRHFRQLRKLTITAPFGVSMSHVDLHMLPPTLRHINFAFNEAESCWYLLASTSAETNAWTPTQRMTRSNPEPEMLDVQKLFPNLVSLELNGAFHVSNSFVSTLPSSMTHLAVQTIDDVRPLGTPAFFDNDGISALPPFLDSLSLSGYFPWTAEDVSNLPRELTSLSLVGISNLNDETLLYLPPTLQHLEFSFSKKTKITMNGLKLLPRFLTSLDIKKAENLKADCFNILPPRLTALHFGGVKINKAQMKSLPRSIISLNLTKVSFSPPCTVENQSVTRALPPHLQSLTIVMDEAVSDDFAQVLPKTLTHLCIIKPPNSGSFGDDFVRWLPRGLLSLHATPHSALSGACVPSLPRGLTHLDLGSATGIGTSPGVLGLLPRHLTRLNIKHWQGLDTAAVNALPRGLEQLSLLNSSNFTDETLAVLPPQLTALELRTSTKLTNAGIQFLPRTLRSISLGSSYLLTGECLVHLPPNVTCLQISTSLPGSDLRPRHPTGPPPAQHQANTQTKSWWRSVLGWIPSLP